MSLTLYFHPLSSFCQKVLIALYENDTPFEPHMSIWRSGCRRGVQGDLADRAVPGAPGRGGGRIIPNSSIIIEYLAQHRPGRTRSFRRSRTAHAKPGRATASSTSSEHADAEDRHRRAAPGGQNDPFGVGQAKEQLRDRPELIEREIDGTPGRWAKPSRWPTARLRRRCSMPTRCCRSPNHKNTAAYFGRLMERASFARVIKEAQPYFALFPG